MNLSRRSRSLSVVLVGVALAGCSAAPVASPTPSPTYACVPEAGGEAVPCGPIEYEQSQRRNALYAEAEAVYRRYWAEKERLASMPDPSWTAELEATTGGAFRESAMELVDRARGRQRVSGEPQLAWVKRLPGLSRSGSIVALEVCTDASGATYASADGGQPQPGLTGQLRLYYSRDQDSVLRIVESEAKEVPTC
jgi:hypothetical protein